MILLLFYISRPACERHGEPGGSGCDWRTEPPQLLWDHRSSHSPTVGLPYSDALHHPAFTMYTVCGNRGLRGGCERFVTRWGEPVSVPGSGVASASLPVVGGATGPVRGHAEELWM